MFVVNFTVVASFLFLFSVALWLWIKRLIAIGEMKQYQLRSPNEKTGLDCFVSIVIPTHNEDSGIVRDTITACLQQKATNFEVVVIDNNTTSEECWRPVSEFCQQHPDRVHFYHVSGITGFKAGAMNWVRPFLSEQSTHIMVIDADYQLKPGAIADVSRRLCKEDIDLLQYPQSYRNDQTEMDAISMEYYHYFKTYMRSGHNRNEVMCTGTLCVIRLAFLDRIEGWPTYSITEDAALSVELLHKGAQTRYVDKFIGAGIKPWYPGDARKQRQRWIRGNAQVIVNMLKKFRWPRTTGVGLHLTAWMDMTGTVLLLTLFSYMLYTYTQSALYLWLIYTGALLVLLERVFLFHLFVTIFQDKLKAVGAFLVHLFYADDGSFSWWSVLLGHRLDFKVTNKIICTTSSYSLPSKTLLLLVGLTVMSFAAGTDYLTIAWTSLFAIQVGAILYTNQLFKFQRQQNVLL